MAESPQFQELHAPLPPAADEISLGELVSHYWRLLRQYYWIILIAVVVCVAGAYFWTKQQPQIYQASSKIIFHEKQGSIFGREIDQVELLATGGRWGFEMFWNSQKQVLRSRWFAERIVKREGLLTREGFLAPPPEGKTRSEKEEMKAAVRRVLAVSTVKLQPDSRVAEVSVETQDAQLSADIANAFTDEYIAYTKEFQSGGLQQIVDWFDNYVASKKQELEQAQQKLQQYKRDHNILSLSYEDRQNLTAANMQAVSDQLSNVRGQLAREEAVLEQIRVMAERGDDLTAIAGLVDVGTEGGTSAIAAAVQQRAELQQEYARLTTRYLGNHPDVQAVKQQLDAVNKHIQAVIDRGRATMRNRVGALRKTEAKLEAQLAGYKKEMFELNDLGVRYGQLKNSEENLEKLYETVLMRSSELNINSLYESNDIQVLEEAVPPEYPVSPVLPLNLAVGFLLGLGLGAGIMVLKDSLDTTIKREEDIAQFTDKPILTTLPKLDPSVLRGLEVMGESAADTITHAAPKSSYAEGIKTLRTNLTFMSPDNPPALMLVTSPGPSEGKTITSVNTAIAMAQSGLKTLIIDADLRRPRLHKALGVGNDIGLSSLVRGDATLDTVTKATPIDGLFTITCGEVPPNPSEMLHSKRFHEIVEEMRGQYDRIIFDSPPLGAVSDALILSRVVDGVLLVVKYAKTRKEMLARSLDQMHGIGAPLMGIVLNEISRGGGGYYGYQYYGNSSYYGSDSDEAAKLAS
jgi:capsular exopolysaccharide synthesis family protein